MSAHTMILDAIHNNESPGAENDIVRDVSGVAWAAAVVRGRLDNLYRSDTELCNIDGRMANLLQRINLRFGIL